MDFLGEFFISSLQYLQSYPLEAAVLGFQPPSFHNDRRAILKFTVCSHTTFLFVIVPRCGLSSCVITGLHLNKTHALSSF